MSAIRSERLVTVRFAPEADMLMVGINVCYVPIADMAQRLPKARSPS
jgi:hypothetical protein